MQNASQYLGELLAVVADHLDIPKSYYERAAARHRSLAEWLQRKESKVAPFDPDVRPQGSFRFGTVTPPLRQDEEYDLDNVCVVRRLSKTALSQYGGPHCQDRAEAEIS